MAEDIRTAESDQIAAGTQQRVAAAAAAILMGVFLVYGIGFASPDAIHNAAHDSRHAFAFPCH